MHYFQGFLPNKLRTNICQGHKNRRVPGENQDLRFKQNFTFKCYEKRFTTKYIFRGKTILLSSQVEASERKLNREYM